MRASKTSLYKYPLMIAFLGIVWLSSILTAPARGQTFKRRDGSVPLRMDWSDQHVIYTVGMTGEQAEKAQGDPRFFVAASLHSKELADESARNGYPISGMRPHREPREENREWKCRYEENRLDRELGFEERTKATSECRTHRINKTEPALKRDWSVSLGSTAGVAAGAYPAKFTYDVNATPSCTTDYAVFPINASTGFTRTNVVGTFSTTVGGASGNTVTLMVTPTGGSSVMLTLTSSTTVNTGMNFQVFTTASTGNATTEALNLALAINRNLSATNAGRIGAIASTNTVSVYTVTPGSGITLSATENLANFSFGTVTAGTNGTQANIVGFNNLYSGSGSPLCTGKTSPTFIFSYASGYGPVTTSPVISLDGTKIAYIENGPSLGAVLHVLTFASGSSEYGSCTNSGTALPTCATAPVVPGSTAGSTATDYAIPLLSALATATTPSATTIPATRSAPFVNYDTDTLFVGDDQGHLYAVTGVFMGTPTLAGGNFPVTVSSGNILNSPVQDAAGTGDIFIGDSASNVFDYSPTGTIVGSSQSIGTSTNGGIHDGAIVDSTNAKVYFTANCTGSGGSGRLAQIPFSSAGFGTTVLTTLNPTGCAASPEGQPVYNAVPDNAYYTKGITSATAGNNGHLVQSSEGGSNAHLYQFQFVSGSLQTAVQFNVTLFTTDQVPSPLAEFYGKDVTYTPSALTQSGNTVTVTTSASNLFVTGQVVTIAGVASGSGGCTTAAIAAINGEQSVTVVSGTQFTFTSAVSTTISSGSCTLSSSTAIGPTQDYLFFGLGSAHLVYTWTLPLTSSSQTDSALNNVDAVNGTSGIIVDNDSSSGQASSIYYGMQSTSTSVCGTTAAFCAIKLTQAALQ